MTYASALIDNDCCESCIMVQSYNAFSKTGLVRVGPSNRLSTELSFALIQWPAFKAGAVVEHGGLLGR